MKAIQPTVTATYHAAEMDRLHNRIYRLEEAISRLERGCSCEYDHRCGNCQAILDAKGLARGEE